MEACGEPPFCRRLRGNSIGERRLSSLLQVEKVRRQLHILFLHLAKAGQQVDFLFLISLNALDSGPQGFLTEKVCKLPVPHLWDVDGGAGLELPHLSVYPLMHRELAALAEAVRAARLSAFERFFARVDVEVLFVVLLRGQDFEAIGTLKPSQVRRDPRH